jgi:2-aminoadipate transaminase
MTAGLTGVSVSAMPLAARMPGLRPSEIRKALMTWGRPGLISLAAGIPAADSFPADRLREAFNQVLRDEPTLFLQYGRTEGYQPLREYLADRVRRVGLDCAPDQVLITNGAQQGLDLASRLLLNEGDHVAVESPTYAGALETFRQYQAGFTVIPADDQGLRPDVLEGELRRDRAPGGPGRIKLLYVMPNFANPSGLTMSLERRRAVAEVAARFQLPVLEDDAYGELRYQGTQLPSLAALHPDAVVIYLGSLSKVLSPGLRVGWMVTPAALVEPLQSLKERSDLHSATGVQMAIMQVVADGFLDGHVRQLVGLYRARRDAMLDEIAGCFPRAVRSIRPDGGFYVWCTLPPAVDASALLGAAAERHVVFVPGRDFHPAGGANSMRLTFSGLAPELLREGVRRLAPVLRQALSADTQEGT